MIRAQEPERKTPGPSPLSSLKAQSQGKAQALLQQPKADLANARGMGWGGAVGLTNPVRSKDVCQPLEAFQLPQVGLQTLYVQCATCVLIQEDCQPTRLPHS
jgi:hypothetical protein